jgi:hypothetical protein
VLQRSVELLLGIESLTGNCGLLCDVWRHGTGSATVSNTVSSGTKSVSFDGVLVC